MDNTMELVERGDLSKLNELRGGREMRTAVIYHTKTIAAGALATQYEFFRAVSGLQEDISGVATADQSNMVLGGKFDEPFLIKNVGIFYNPFDTSGKTDSDMKEDFMLMMNQGSFKLEINSKQVLQLSPLAVVGSVLNYGGFASTGSSGADLVIANNIMPIELNPMIFCPEGVNVRALINWTTAITMENTTQLGIFLYGNKFNKA
jgi:hypothetical protein